MSLRVLLVEDDELIGTMVEVNLHHHGFEATWAKSAEDGLELVAAGRFDAILLDLMLPGMNGLELAAELRRRSVSTPVLMLTVRDEIGTKVSAFDGGIDDYMTKPFDMEELVARLKALIRRSRAAGEVPASARIPIAGGEVHLGALRFDDAAGVSHALSEKEAELLSLFARNAGNTLSRSDIIDEVWGMDALPSERTVDNFILRLRRLIEKDPETPRYLVTVRGRGYRFDP